jgi:outer membrane protein OmpA-like peptidoglycan-associated protein
MLAAGTLAIVPTLLFAQQRPAQQPAQRPAAQPAQRPAAQPAQRPAPVPARPMAGPHREGSWELSAGVGGFAVGQAFNGTSGIQVMPGGMLRVGYNLNPMWNISVGTGIGMGKSVTSSSAMYLTPSALVTWTPDLNKRTSPFVDAGVGMLYRSDPSVDNTAVGGQVGVGVRHMIGDALALRIEASALIGSVTAGTSEISGAGLVSVGLSYFLGGKKILTHIAVNPGTATLASLRATQQFSAIAHDQNGQPMTGKVFEWRSSNPAVATVSPTGMVTAVGDGSAAITARSETVTGTANVMVSRTAGNVAVAPATGTLSALGATQQFTASARDAGNSPIANAAFTWTSSSPAVATVSPTGLVTAVGNGTARITATSAGKTATSTVTVAQTTMTVTVTPATSQLTAAGATSQLSAQAMDANGQQISGKAFTWTSDAAGVATVSASGLATAVANGVAHVSAAADGKTGSGIVTVVIATRAAPAIELPSVNASIVMRNVTFQSNRAVLTPAATTELDKVAITMQGMPNSKWEIGGYTSNVGTAARNLRLSQQRADAVKKYLVSKGVADGSLTAVGYGVQHPIGNNRTAAGRRQNMRVEIKRLQ